MSEIERVGALVPAAFDAWEMARSQVPDVVVEDSVPILYFGDLDAYLASPRRIVTVALNPSRAEFPKGNPLQRFPLAEGVDPDSYLAALNAYFKTSPYGSWFSSFEQVLSGLDASYYPGAESTALHTDLCSPVATDPTWSRLGGDVREALIIPGVPLWHDLMRALRPDVIVISVARRHLGSIEFDRLTRPAEIHRVVERRTRPYVVQSWTVDVEGKESMVVFGAPAQTPFALISHHDKTRVGRAIGETLGRPRSVVQFPHPGGEHSPDRPGWKDWNLGRHARKFLISPGRWRDEPDGPDQSGDLVFWGEWEPPSRIVAELAPRADSPRYVHEPVCTEPPDHPTVQNTDPFVFGDRFLYSNCKQNTKRGPLRTQRLREGSLILFGSPRGGEFLLDTVFVVAGSRPLEEAHTDPHLDPVFRAVTGDLLLPRDDEMTFRLYEGATPDEPVAGMYSFVPCLPVEGEPEGFPRPSIEVEGVNPRNRQALKFTDHGSLAGVRRVWEQVVDQVLAQGLVLGTQVASPEHVGGPSARPRTNSSVC